VIDMITDKMIEKMVLLMQSSPDIVESVKNQNRDLFDIIDEQFNVKSSDEIKVALLKQEVTERLMQRLGDILG